MAINKKIVTQLSKEFNLTPEAIEGCITHQFKFVRDTIQKGEGESVRLAYFGLFRLRKDVDINAPRKTRKTRV
jgi:nucleoid DNA-binding protein